MAISTQLSLTHPEGVSVEGAIAIRNKVIEFAEGLGLDCAVAATGFSEPALGQYDPEAE